MNCTHVWVGWMQIRQLMLRWQDKDTVTSVWRQQRCLAQQTMDDTVILTPRKGCIDWMKFVKCINKSTNKNCHQLIWLTISTLFLWEIFWHWLFYSFVKLKGLFFINDLKWTLHLKLLFRIRDHPSAWIFLAPEYAPPANYENQQELQKKFKWFWLLFLTI